MANMAMLPTVKVRVEGEDQDRDIWVVGCTYMSDLKDRLSEVLGVTTDTITLCNETRILQNGWLLSGYRIPRQEATIRVLLQGAAFPEGGAGAGEEAVTEGGASADEEAVAEGCADAGEEVVAEGGAGAGEEAVADVGFAEEAIAEGSAGV